MLYLSATDFEELALTLEANLGPVSETKDYSQKEVSRFSGGLKAEPVMQAEPTFANRGIGESVNGDGLQGGAAFRVWLRCIGASIRGGCV